MGLMPVGATQLLRTQGTEGAFPPPPLPTHAHTHIHTLPQTHAHSLCWSAISRACDGRNAKDAAGADVVVTVDEVADGSVSSSAQGKRCGARELLKERGLLVTRYTQLKPCYKVWIQRGQAVQEQHRGTPGITSRALPRCAAAVDLLRFGLERLKFSPAQPQCRCGMGEPSPGADVARVSLKLPPACCHRGSVARMVRQR
jgi:hypothetical protein